MQRRSLLLHDQKHLISVSTLTQHDALDEYAAQLGTDDCVQGFRYDSKNPWVIKKIVEATRSEGELGSSEEGALMEGPVVMGVSGDAAGNFLICTCLAFVEDGDHLTGKIMVRKSSRQSKRNSEMRKLAHKIVIVENVAELLQNHMRYKCSRQMQAHAHGRTVLLVSGHIIDGDMSYSLQASPMTSSR